MRVKRGLVCGLNEGDGEFEDRREDDALALRAPEIDRGVGAGLTLHQYAELIGAGDQANGVDALGVRAIKAYRDADDRRENADDGALVLGEIA